MRMTRTVAKILLFRSTLLLVHIFENALSVPRKVVGKMIVISNVKVSLTLLKGNPGGTVIKTNNSEDHYAS